MRGMILIVEDNDILRWLMSEALTYLGHGVVESANADDAFKKLEEGNPLGLVITDWQMPGHHDGLDLAKRIWAVRPELPVIIASSLPPLSPDLLPHNARFISKPYTLDTLNGAISELLTDQ